MPAVSTIRTGQQPTCFDKIKLGFMMGCGIGMASGVLFGGFSSLRMGMRGMELLKATGNRMMQGGGTFGTFMAIGSAIRC